MKQCSKCKQVKDLDKFGKHTASRDGLKSQCKDCRNEDNRKPARREYDRERAKTPARREAARKYGKTPARLKAVRERSRTFHLRSFKLTEADIDAMLKRQNGKCANQACLSEKPGGRGRFHIDHDHRCCPGKGSCGKCVRGLLCNNCNRAAGLMQDLPERLRGLAAYLEGYNK